MCKDMHFDHGQIVYEDFEQFIYAVVQDLDYRMSRIEIHLDIEPKRDFQIRGKRYEWRLDKESY